MLKPVIGLRDGGGTERIGLNEISVRFQIGVTDVAHDFRPRQRQKIIVAFEIVLVIVETGAAKIAFAQAMTLDHNPPGTIQKQDAGLRLLLHPGDA